MGEKYNYQTVWTEDTVAQSETSQAKILRQIDPGSRVLECGPGFGEMTRYMKEVLKCEVFIIEMDPDCYDHAIQYADNGLCVDLETDSWMEELETEYFDFITYADVLEHLRDPQTTLGKMRRFLKPDGSVLLSVPNVANGDIIMNLLCDRFTYTPLGLLDNTHIHFFARENLKNMIKEAGFFLANESCTLYPLFASEQGGFIPLEDRAGLEQALARHPTRNVYQYICRLTLSETETQSDVDDLGNENTEPQKSRFYFDMGDGFSEMHRIDVMPELEESRLCYNVLIPDGCTSVRYDPVEAQKCIAHKVSVHVDGRPVSAVPLNGVSVGSDFLFCDEDPQVGINIPKGSKEMRLETNITLLSESGWREVQELVVKAQRQMVELLTIKENQLQAVNGAKEQAESALKLTQDALMVKEEQLQAVNGAKEQTESALGVKCRQLDAVNDAKAQIEFELEMVRRALEEKTEENVGLESRLHSVESSLSWKLTSPLRHLKKLGRGESR